MAPRDADALPDAMPIPRPVVTDFGDALNLTAAASPFSHGLNGVDQYMNYLFANAIVGSFLALLGLTLIYRWIKMGNAHMRHLFTMNRDSDQRYFMHNHGDFWPKVKRSILYAPLWKNRHNKEIQITQAVTIGTLPSRFHTVLLLAYVLSNIAYCLALDWTKPDYEVVAELRGRTGVLAALNLIPTVLFALRNNPLISILKVSYDTFNLLHRWCARIMVFESIIHTIMWAVNAVKAGGYDQISISLSTSMSYTWGMVGTGLFTFMALSAFGPLRHAAYETFINSHRLMVLVSIIAVYLHLDLANLPMLPYVQLSLAFWAAEVVWRIGRILYHNASRKRGLTKVTVEWLPNDACRVTFELSRPWKWRPGCHVHAYIPTLALWSSHPFSIAWAENRSQGAPMEIEMEKFDKMPASSTGIFDPAAAQRNSHFGARSSVFASPLRNSVVAPRTSVFAQPVRSSNYMSPIVESPTSSIHKLPKLAPTTTLTQTTSHASSNHDHPTPDLTLPRDANVTSLSLVIRARTGMTRHMYNRVAASPTRSFTTWGAIEGPYGGHESLSSYGTVILFAGGVGITHCIGYIRHLLLQYQAGTTSTRKILLVWSVPTTESLEWVRAWMDTILRMECRREVLRIQLFVTKPRHRGEVVSSTGSVQMFPGRCNPTTILKREVPERIGAMGVTVCGPGAFADNVRAACRSVVREVQLDFVEEAYTY
ncbi:unnamed protein product [Zymoseptoria tritici ST99CH_3D7]|uniref:FAD-binding FR-type domain-containing protein n=1 Tax=Zymoseptoria tritici (strain ST99CH_3D7) TaxID=1276538 RepID=A0A1X7S4E0_ZYMT9|nr:unnamed protein product [Zymoseptoria tritici ST99CH_3D7]